MRFLLIFLGAAILLATLSSCESDSTQANAVAQATTQEQTPSGEQTNYEAVPSGVSFTAADLDGQMHHSSEWLGKMPVVINVWGTWCPPCRREIPDLIRVYNEFRDQGIEMVGLAVPPDTPEKVRKFTAQNDMEWVMLIANRQTTTTLGRIGGVPTTIFYDREGNEVERFVGPRPYEVFKETFEKIL